MSVAVRLARGNVLDRMDTLGQAKSIPPARHSHHFVQITAAIAALAGLLFGFDTGVISGAILFIKGAFKLAPFMEELLLSAALIGAVCGCILSGRVTDRYYRARRVWFRPARGSGFSCRVASYPLWHRISRYSTNHRHQHGDLLCADDLRTSRFSFRSELDSGHGWRRPGECGDDHRFDSIAGPGGPPASAVDQPGWNVRVAARS